MNLLKKIFFVFLFLMLTAGGFAIDSQSTGYRIDGYGCKKINIPSFSFVKSYKNSCPTAFFIPTRTKNELLSFDNNKPSCVTVMQCNTYTYYIGSSGSACCPSTHPYKRSCSILDYGSRRVSITCCDVPSYCW